MEKVDIQMGTERKTLKFCFTVSFSYLINKLRGVTVLRREHSSSTFALSTKTPYGTKTSPRHKRPPSGISRISDLHHSFLTLKMNTCITTLVSSSKKDKTSQTKGSSFLFRSISWAELNVKCHLSRISPHNVTSRNA